jgi:hypothetical protein
MNWPKIEPRLPTTTHLSCGTVSKRWWLPARLHTQRHFPKGTNRGDDFLCQVNNCYLLKDSALLLWLFPFNCGTTRDIQIKLLDTTVLGSKPSANLLYEMYSEILQLT